MRSRPGVAVVLAALLVSGCSGETRSGFTGADSDRVCGMADRLSAAQVAIGEGDSSPGHYRGTYPELLSAWDAAAEVAPAEIEPHLQRVSRGNRAYWEAFARVNFDLKKATEIAREVVEDDVVSDTDHLAVEAYFSEVCRVEVDG